MTHEEIINGNKLIAEFMGLEIITDGISFFDTSYKALKKYNSDWNDLIPVVEKINNMFFDVQICRISVKISNIMDDKNPIVSLVCGDISKKIELIWLAVVQFIQWYNNQK